MQRAAIALRALRCELARANGATRSRACPLLVKIAPDMSDAELEALLAIVDEAKLAGGVATNTTIAPATLPTHPGRVATIGAGGLSGPPLRARALEVVARVRARLGREMTVVGVGGVEARTTILGLVRAGANLVQIYMYGLHLRRALPRLLHCARAHAADGCAGGELREGAGGEGDYVRVITRARTTDVLVPAPAPRTPIDTRAVATGAVVHATGGPPSTETCTAAPSRTRRKRGSRLERAHRSVEHGLIHRRVAEDDGGRGGAGVPASRVKEANVASVTKTLRRRMEREAQRGPSGHGSRDAGRNEAVGRSERRGGEEERARDGRRGVGAARVRGVFRSGGRTVVPSIHAPASTRWWRPAHPSVPPRRSPTRAE